MLTITDIDDSYKQSFDVKTEDNKIFTVTLEYKVQITRWVISITYGNFKSGQFMLCTHFNILNRFKKVLPFAIMCSSIGGGEPWFRGDFLSKRVILSVFSGQEKKDLEKIIIG